MHYNIYGETAESTYQIVVSKTDSYTKQIEQIKTQFIFMRFLTVW